MKKIDSYISSLNSLKGKKVVITGANSGIGFEIARLCLLKEADVVLACRNQSRANDALAKLKRDFPDRLINILLYTQETLESSARFIDELINKHDDFDVLILNAGVYKMKEGDTNIDGLPITSAVNCFGVLKILDSLNKYLINSTKERRIIIQGSLIYKLSRIADLEKGLQNPFKRSTRQYSDSKLALLNIFDYYSKRNKNPYIKYLLSEPGVCYTNIIRNYSKFIRVLAKPFMTILFNSLTCAALTSLFLASGEVANGDYFIPKTFFHTKGYPTKGLINKKYLDQNLTKKLLNLINSKY